MVTRRIREDGDERGMLIYTLSGHRRVQVPPGAAEKLNLKCQTPSKMWGAFFKYIISLEEISQIKVSLFHEIIGGK